MQATRWLLSFSVIMPTWFMVEMIVIHVIIPKPLLGTQHTTCLF